MKYFLIFCFAILAASPSFSQTDAVAVTVEGLGCPYCAAGLEKKLSKIQGIKDIGIELKTGVASFTVPASLKIDETAVRQKVEDAGYTAKAVTILRNKGIADLPKTAVAPKKKGKAGH